jgi:hypothetical protein
MRFYDEKGWNYESSFSSGKSTYTIEFKCNDLKIKVKAVEERSETQKVVTSVAIALHI